MHFSAIVAAILAASSAASAASTDKRQGPSGQVISPAGGAQYSATTGYPDGRIHFIYQAVFQAKTDNCAFFSCIANTQSLKVVLQNNGNSYTLADRLAPPSNTAVSNIEAWLSIPASVCGSSNLVVTESQNLYGQQVTFRAAAPSIRINCAPLP